MIVYQKCKRVNKAPSQPSNVVSVLTRVKMVKSILVLLLILSIFSVPLSRNVFVKVWDIFRPCDGAPQQPVHEFGKFQLPLCFSISAKQTDSIQRLGEVNPRSPAGRQRSLYGENLESDHRT